MSKGSILGKVNYGNLIKGVQKAIRAQTEEPVWWADIWQKGINYTIILPLEQHWHYPFVVSAYRAKCQIPAPVCAV